jgi:hypothetical protein
VVCSARLDRRESVAEYEGASIADEVFRCGLGDMLVMQTWCPVDLTCELPQTVCIKRTPTTVVSSRNIALATTDGRVSDVAR